MFHFIGIHLADSDPAEGQAGDELVWPAAASVVPFSSSALFAGTERPRVGVAGWCFISEDKADIFSMLLLGRCLAVALHNEGCK